MKELPDKIISIDQLIINRRLEKDCKCQERKFVVDTQNRRIQCGICGAVVDAYEAMYELSKNGEALQRQTERLLEQRRQIMDYKPWLLTIRNLEKQYRGQKMLPNCPRCKEPFYLEELVSWMGKPFADARIKEYKESKNSEETSQDLEKENERLKEQNARYYAAIIKAADQLENELDAYKTLNKVVEEFK